MATFHESGQRPVPCVGYVGITVLGGGQHRLNKRGFDLKGPQLSRPFDDDAMPAFCARAGKVGAAASCSRRKPSRALATVTACRLDRRDAAASRLKRSRLRPRLLDRLAQVRDGTLTSCGRLPSALVVAAERMQLTTSLGTGSTTHVHGPIRSAQFRIPRRTTTSARAWWAPCDRSLAYCPRSRCGTGTPKGARGSRVGRYRLLRSVRIGRGYFRTTAKWLLTGRFWGVVERFQARSTRGYRRVVVITGV